MRERASLEIEQNVIGLSTDAGEMVLKQIAGWIARRVVCWKKLGESVARGERIGLIRFGSRVDGWLPREAEILVPVGESVRGGSSVLARWPAPRRNASAEDMDSRQAQAGKSAGRRRGARTRWTKKRSPSIHALSAIRGSAAPFLCRPVPLPAPICWGCINPWCPPSVESP